MTDDDLKVGGILTSDTYVPSLNPEGRQKKKDQERRDEKDEVADHFQELAAAAERTHSLLEKSGSPFRFCVYQQGDQVFIDLVILSEDGKVKEIKKQDITHQEFSTWIKAIEEGEGLFFSDVS